MSQTRCFCQCHFAVGDPGLPLLSDPVNAATACSQCAKWHCNPFVPDVDPPRDPWTLTDGEGAE